MRKILVVVALALLNVALPSLAVGQNQATAQEVVAKVREAASTFEPSSNIPTPSTSSGQVPNFAKSAKLECATPLAGPK